MGWVVPFGLAPAQSVHARILVLRAGIAHLVTIAVSDLIQESSLGAITVARRSIVNQRSNVAGLGRVGGIGLGALDIGAEVARILIALAVCDGDSVQHAIAVWPAQADAISGRIDAFIDRGRAMGIGGIRQAIHLMGRAIGRCDRVAKSLVSNGCAIVINIESPMHGKSLE